MNTSVYIVIAIVLFVILRNARKGGIRPEQTMTAAELRSRLDTDPNLVVLDVRTKEELTGPLGAIKKCLHIPLHELDSRIAEVERFRGREIAVICRSGNRSGTATVKLLKIGFNARNVTGGMNAFRAL